MHEFVNAGTKQFSSYAGMVACNELDYVHPATLEPAHGTFLLKTFAIQI